MFLNKASVSLWLLSVAGSASAFSTSSKGVAFVARSAPVATSQSHTSGCACANCGIRPGTFLFADVAEEVEVPDEVAALDGVESEEEAHNVDRPARSSISKKRAPKGKDLSEFEAGSMVKGTVRSITSYGAFVDFGAATDGLLHISQLSTEYVGDVNDIISEKQEIEVRIVSIDTDKGQVALSLLSEEESANAGGRPRRERSQRQNNRRDDSAVLASLSEKGWETATFVEGQVVSTVDFGCFVRVDASLFNSECEGTLDGLVHISAMATGRVNSVTDVVSVDEKVQVRMKAINGNKVSFTMLSVEDEESKAEAAAAASGDMGEGAKDWKESLEKFDATMPVFKNGPVVEDRRK